MHLNLRTITADAMKYTESYVMYSVLGVKGVCQAVLTERLFMLSATSVLS